MVGIDEVGRGALAGPLVVCGLYFTENPGFITGLNDSKKLSRKTREKVALQIMSSAHFALAKATPQQIDRLGLTGAMRKCVLEIAAQMPSSMKIVIDGSYNYLKDSNYEQRSKAVIKADQTHPSVMAASIIAKVERDRLMRSYDTKFGIYKFISNVGYGTQDHLTSLRSNGPSPHHRKSFEPLKSMIGWSK